MALPQQLKSARMDNNTDGDKIDNNVGDLESAICDILGFTIDSDVTESPLSCDNAGRITKALLRLVASGPVGIRFRDSDEPDEFRIAFDGSVILIDQNTGTEGSPAWTNRISIDAATGDITTNVKMTGTLEVTGNADLNGDLDVAGDLTRGGNDIWGEDNDGPGSGLDADTVDGLEASAFAKVDYIKLVDRKASGTDGGAATAGSWETRDINIEETDTGDHCSVSSNQITLAAGTYDVFIRCPAYNVNGHRARLYQTSGTPAELIMGSNAFSFSSGGVQTDSVIHGRIVLAGSTTMEIQHRVQTTNATNGYGVHNSLTYEYYTTAEFRKVA